MPVILTARRLVAFIGVFVVAYIWWIGPERLCYESIGTWILSPLIYARLLPLPLNHLLVTAMVHHPFVGSLLCGVPIALLGWAFVFAAYAIYWNSMYYAFTAWLLVGGVVSVYHQLQPMGMTLIR